MYTSLGMKALLASLGPDRRQGILDLGRALGSNVDFWSQFSCRLYFGDLYREVVASGGHEDPDLCMQAYEQSLKFDEGTVFDVILAWDLFNYLNHGQFESLVRFLAGYCRNGTLLFALISTSQTIPAEPTVFRIMANDKLIYLTAQGEPKPSPRYQPRDINQMMAGFKVSHSFLLRHGMREYVFEFEGG